MQQRKITCRLTCGRSCLYLSVLNQLEAQRKTGMIGESGFCSGFVDRHRTEQFYTAETN